MSGIEMTVGVVGGIVAPIVKRQIRLRRDDHSGTETGWLKTLHPGQGYRYERADLQRGSLEHLAHELETAGLFGLPVEDPPAGEDIYGQDTIIRVDLPQEKWANGAPRACLHAGSRVHATEAQKAVFAQAIHIINTAAQHWPLHAVPEADYPRA
ncbi:MAG: hypothetical protein ACYCW6_12180 [Candidatus Xenobia bacterium]